MLNTPAKPLSPACASARASAFSGEATRLPPVDRLHLASCPRCKPLWQQVRRLTARSRRLPLPPAPTALRDRVLEQVQMRSTPTAFQPDVAPNARKRFPYKPVVAGIAGVIAVGGTIGVGTENWARWFPSVQSQIPTVMRAAQTWHFKGWRTENGKQVPWEIWGRRQPFLYREQIGDLMFVDNGNTRTQVLPPTQTRPHGLVVTSDTKSLPTMNGLSAQNALFLAGGTFGWERFNQVSRDGQDLVLQGSLAYVEDVPSQEQNSNGAAGNQSSYLASRQPKQKQRVEDNLLLRANAGTKMPVQFSITEVRYAPRGVSTPGNASPVSAPVVGQGRRNKGAPVSRTKTAELVLSYDVPLPPDVEKVEAPNTYTRVDATQMNTPPGPATDHYTALDITVKGSVTALDKDGNLIVQLEPASGSYPYRPVQRVPGVSVYVPETVFDLLPSRANSAQPWMAVDDRGRRYVAINGPDYSKPYSRDKAFNRYSEMYLVPLEPLSVTAPRPRRLELIVQVSRYLGEWTRGNHIINSVQPLQRSGTLALPLPVQTASLDYDPPTTHVGKATIYYSKNGVNGTVSASLRRTLAYEAARKRAEIHETLANMIPSGNAGTREAAQAAASKAKHVRQAIEYHEQLVAILRKQTGADYYVTSELEAIERLRKSPTR